MNIVRGRGPKIIYLFRAGRRERLADSQKGPTEFFYGFQQLLAKGIDVSMLEDSDVGMAPPLSTLARLANKLSPLMGGFPVGMALSLLLVRGYRRLRTSDCIITTKSGMGMSLALIKALGGLNTPVLHIAMGLLPLSTGFIKVRLVSLLIKEMNVVCISRSEQKFLQRIFPGQDIGYIPFGVDHHFWTPNVRHTSAAYVLAIGNDPSRDWQTLVSAWSEDFLPLKIVTSLPVPIGSGNITVISGDWRTQRILDTEIRDLYQNATFVIVPLKDTIQPSGQSVCLQAMACGRAVILSDIRGLWDTDLLRHRKNVVLVRPGSVIDLKEAIKSLLIDKNLCDFIGAEARKLVESQFTTELMASNLADIIKKHVLISAREKAGEMQN